ncbi:hypothetical protein OROGR_029844 [Orobanche gracilis]
MPAMPPSPTAASPCPATVSPSPETASLSPAASQSLFRPLLQSHTANATAIAAETPNNGTF